MNEFTVHTTDKADSRRLVEGQGQCGINKAIPRWKSHVSRIQSKFGWWSKQLEFNNLKSKGEWVERRLTRLQWEGFLAPSLRAKLMAERNLNLLNLVVEHEWL